MVPYHMVYVKYSKSVAGKIYYLVSDCKCSRIWVLLAIRLHGFITLLRPICPLLKKDHINCLQLMPYRRGLHCCVDKEQHIIFIYDTMGAR